MSEQKTKLNDASVTAFLDKVTDPQKRADCDWLLGMMSTLTGSEPKMWGGSIIGFDSYHYVYASGREGDWPIIGFSPRAKNLSLYIMSGFEKYDDLMSKLGKHKTGKSCLYLNKLEDVDLEVLKELATQSVAHMREQYPQD